MDYYYSLLESYQQLKRRTFKLSLREQEEDAARKQARQDADAAFATPIEISPKDRKTKASGDVLIFVKSGPDLDKVSAIGGPFQTAWMKGVNSLDELDDKTLSRVVGYFMGDSEGAAGGEGKDGEGKDGEGKDEGEETSAPEEQQDILSPSIEAIANTLEKIDRDEELKLLAKGEEDQDGEEFDDEETTIAQEDKLTVEEQRIKLEEISKTTGEYTEFDEATVEKTLQGVNALLTLGLRLSNDRPGTLTGKYVEETSQLIAEHNITTDQYGCIRFDGVGIGVCSEEAGQFLSQMYDYIPLIQRAQEKDREQKGIGSEARIIPEVPLEEPDDKGRGVAVENMDAYSQTIDNCMKQMEDKRKMDKGCLDSMGPEVISSWQRHDDLEKGRDIIRNREDLTDEQKEKELKKFDRKAAKHPGKLGQDIDYHLRNLAVGILAQKSAILTGPKEARAAATVRFLEDRLIAEGATPEDAKEFLRQAAGMNPDGSIDITNENRIKALLVMALGNRNFARKIRGSVTPTMTIGVGQGQLERSGEIGAKQDLLDVYCSDDPKLTEKHGDKEGDIEKALVDNVKSLLGPDQKALYSKKCGKGEGTEKRLNNYIKNNVIQKLTPEQKEAVGVECGEGATAYAISREPKVHDGQTNSTLGQVSGEKVTAIFNYLCKNAEERKGYDRKDGVTGVLSQGETDHLDKNIKRQNECGEKGKEEGEARVSGACEFKKKLDSTVSRLLAPLDPNNEEAQSVEGSDTRPYDATIDTWKNNTTMNGEKANARAEAAKRFLSGGSAANGTEEADLKQLNNIKRDVEAAAFRDLLIKSKDREANGTLSGKAKAFAQTMYSIGAAARGEVINEKRILSTNSHSVGLRNAEVYSNEAEAKFVHGTGSSFSVVGADGKKRATVTSTISGSKPVYKVQTAGKELYNEISDDDTPEEIRQLIKAGKVKYDGKWMSKNQAKNAKDKDNNKKSKKQDKKQENLMMAFLQGQHALLEKLITQTTSNPNT